MGRPCAADDGLTSPTRETDAPSAPSSRTARPVSRCRAREPRAVDSSRRTAASRPAAVAVSGSGAVTRRFLPRGRAGHTPVRRRPGTGSQHPGAGMPPTGTGVSSGGRGGRHRGLPGRAPAVGGRGGGRTASAGTRVHGPGDVVQHRASPSGRTASRFPGARRRWLGGLGAVGQVRTGQRPGDGTSLIGYREDLVPSPATDPVGRAGVAAHVCASLEGPRAARGRVGGGSRREPSCVEVGRRPEVHRRRGARWRPRSACRLRRLGDRVVGRGHPGKRATGLGVLGEGGGRRPAAGCRGRAVLRCGSAGSLQGRVPRGTSSRRSPGTGRAAPAAENRGPGRTPGHRVSGPGRLPPARPVLAAASRWPGSVQGVRAVLRRGRPLLHGGPAASPAIRSTPDRGETAPQRGKAPRAGSDGGAGHLAQHHGTVGLALAPGRRAGPPQARYSPRGPAPQSATRRSRPRSRPGRQAAAAGRSAAAPVPSGGRGAPGEVLALRSGTPERGPADTRSASPATGAAGLGQPRGRGARPGSGGPSGAGCTERSGTRADRAPARAPAGRWATSAAAAGGAACAGPPSARSSTSIRPARLRPAAGAVGSADMRAAAVRSLAAHVASSEVVSAAGEGAADKEKGRQRGRPFSAVRDIR